MRLELGEFIVADTRVCHGQLTFRGTRILVSSILSDVERGMDWQEIIDEWDGRISREAIAEAIRLAHQALHRQDTKAIAEAMAG